jgi:hypothetical protein
MPSGSPQSVPDPYADDYDEMIKRWLQDTRIRSDCGAQPVPAKPDDQIDAPWQLGETSGGGASLGDMLDEFQRRKPVPHPGFTESLLPVWGSGKEALADLEDRDYLGAGLNTAAAVSDLVPLKSLASGLLKGGFKLAGPMVWRMAPWKEDVEKGVMSASTWMRQPRAFGLRHLEPGQPGHHLFVHQNGEGKVWPDWLKNQPWNIKPMKNAEVHGRLHHQYNGLPPFKGLERYWHGTPDWLKALNASYGARVLDDANDGLREWFDGLSAPPPQRKGAEAPTASQQRR